MNKDAAFAVIAVGVQCMMIIFALRVSSWTNSNNGPGSPSPKGRLPFHKSSKAKDANNKVSNSSAGSAQQPPGGADRNVREACSKSPQGSRGQVLSKEAVDQVESADVDEGMRQFLEAQPYSILSSSTTGGDDDQQPLVSAPKPLKVSDPPLEAAVQDPPLPSTPNSEGRRRYEAYPHCEPVVVDRVIALEFDDVIPPPVPVVDDADSISRDAGFQQSTQTLLETMIMQQCCDRGRSAVEARLRLLIQKVQDHPGAYTCWNDLKRFLLLQREHERQRGLLMQSELPPVSFSDGDPDLVALQIEVRSLIAREKIRYPRGGRGSLTTTPRPSTRPLANDSMVAPDDDSSSNDNEALLGGMEEAMMLAEEIDSIAAENEALLLATNDSVNEESRAERREEFSSKGDEEDDEYVERMFDEFCEKLEQRKANIANSKDPHHSAASFSDLRVKDDDDSPLRVQRSTDEFDRSNVTGALMNSNDAATTTGRPVAVPPLPKLVSSTAATEGGASHGFATVHTPRTSAMLQGSSVATFFFKKLQEIKQHRSFSRLQVDTFHYPFLEQLQQFEDHLKRLSQKEHPDLHTSAEQRAFLVLPGDSASTTAALRSDRKLPNITSGAIKFSSPECAVKSISLVREIGANGLRSQDGRKPSALPTTPVGPARPVLTSQRKPSIIVTTLPSSISSPQTNGSPRNPPVGVKTSSTTGIPSRKGSTISLHSPHVSSALRKKPTAPAFERSTSPLHHSENPSSPLGAANPNGFHRCQTDVSPLLKKRSHADTLSLHSVASASSLRAKGAANSSSAAAVKQFPRSTSNPLFK